MPWSSCTARSTTPLVCDTRFLEFVNMVFTELGFSITATLIEGSMLLCDLLIVNEKLQIHRFSFFHFSPGIPKLKKNEKNKNGKISRFMFFTISF